MSEKNAVREFMTAISIGQIIYIPLVCAAFLIAGRFGLNIFLGALYGSAAMLLYYFLFARATVKAADEADPETAKKRIRAAHSLRMFLLIALMGLGLFFSTDYAPIIIFHWLPIIISMLVPRITIAVWQIINRKKNADSNSEKEGE